MRLVDLPGAGNPARRGGPQCRHPRRSEINDAGARDIFRRRVALGANDRRHAALCQTAGLSRQKYTLGGVLPDRAPSRFSPASRARGCIYIARRLRSNCVQPARQTLGCRLPAGEQYAPRVCGGPTLPLTAAKHWLSQSGECCALTTSGCAFLRWYSPRHRRHALRDRVIGSLGENGYRAAFAAASIIGLGWLVAAYNRAPTLSPGECSNGGSRLR